VERFSQSGADLRTQTDIGFFLESRLQFVLASGEGDILQLFLINDKNK